MTHHGVGAGGGPPPDLGLGGVHNIVNLLPPTLFLRNFGLSNFCISFFPHAPPPLNNRSYAGAHIEHGVTVPVVPHVSRVVFHVSASDTH